ncbi:MAG: L-seryl-tRNA(Sec) selenium transferase [Spirochaetes bacterium]|nr:L-seryl-tRNA(Sec) selenium transferase [Spirochaetota bacterium]
MMEDKNLLLRSIPQVDKILQSDEVQAFVAEIGRPLVADIIREVLAEARAGAGRGEQVDPAGIVSDVASRCAKAMLRKLRRVVNGTGVLIHTNLGRSPLGEEVLGRLAEELSGYCNLEYDLPARERGKRGGFAEELMCRCTGAEDALIVNNNASSVFLILNEFANGKEVVVSRGELIQIGGGFRLPDIMSQSGPVLVEAGTTNITTIRDYRAAVTGNTAMVLSCHRSNFTIEGFTESPSLAELASLKSESVIFVRDLGSGNLVTDQRLPRPFEPTVRSELEQGPDLVCFSGDKLLGGCQAGVIVGRKDLIARLRRNPLMRMIRVDKVTYFIIQETLLHHVNGDVEKIELWDAMLRDMKDVSRRVNRFFRLMKSRDKRKFVKRVKTRCTVGGGAMPGFEMESRGVQIHFPGVQADEIHAAFLSAKVPLVGSIVNNRFTIDFFTISKSDVPHAAGAADMVLSRYGGA